MGDEEKGIKWWVRYVIVPILVGGGVIGYILKSGENPDLESPCSKYKEIEGVWSDDNQLSVFKLLQVSIR